MPKKTLHNLPKLEGSFIDREEVVKKILEKLGPESRAWLIAVCGVGGVGKSTLALSVARHLISQSDFDAVVWASSKSQQLTKSGVRAINKNLLTDLDDLLNAIAQVLHIESAITESQGEKHEIIRSYLKSQRVLIIVDNLESVDDHDAAQILWFLRDLLPNPSKALITSRYRLAGEGEYAIQLNAFSFEDSVEFMRTETRLSEFFRINRLDDKTMRRVYHATGGIPLAIKWILGQATTRRRKQISEILDKLARSKDEPLLEYCFRQSFRQLSRDTKNLLMSMSVLRYPTSQENIGRISGFRENQLRKSIDELLSMSLIEHGPSGGGEHVVMLPLTQAFARAQLSKETGLEEQTLIRLEKESGAT